VLVFSYTGYDPQEIAVGTQTTIDVLLTEGIQLDEVVVTALGIEVKKDELGSTYSNHTDQGRQYH